MENAAPAQPQKLSELESGPIAAGRIAEIYPWERGKVIKLAHDWVPDDWLTYEFRIAKIVHSTGLRVPEPFDLRYVEGRCGIVYERVDGPTMLVQFEGAPLRVWSFGRELGRLHAEMHAKPGHEDLPASWKKLEAKITSVEGAPQEIQDAALARVKELYSEPPGGGERLLHGDFHPDNIIQAADGPVIIDWPDASRGNPLGDVARTVILANLGGLPPNPVLRLLVGLLRRQVVRAYLRTYFQHSAFNRADLDRWIFPVLFARLSEDIESERQRSAAWLRKLYKREER